MAGSADPQRVAESVERELSVDEIELTGMERIHELLDYLDSAESARTHRLRVLRGGELTELFWVSSGI